MTLFPARPPPQRSLIRLDFKKGILCTFGSKNRIYEYNLNVRKYGFLMVRKKIRTFFGLVKEKVAFCQSRLQINGPYKMDLLLFKQAGEQWTCKIQANTWMQVKCHSWLARI